MRRPVVQLAVLFLFTLVAFAQEPSLGDVARAKRTQQSKTAHATRVFSNEDSGPSEIKDGEDPIAVYNRAALGLLHDTGHRCQQDSVGNSGPGSRRMSIFEVAAADRMHMIEQEGSARREWLQVADAYYLKDNGASWRKLARPEEISLAQSVFPAAGIPQEMQYRFEPGELKLIGDQAVGGLPAVRYQFVTHSKDFDRTVSLWIGKKDSLPYRIEMRTESGDTTTAPTVWQESISCSYGVDVNFAAPVPTNAPAPSTELHPM